ncbi:hypothetical protein KL930_004013 [Ogataea haglerorum]|uniref:Uncharacterized protein n=1 Tax=Ogataea haglerorum TaxID=1937702 RepID=A0AAN6DAC1_9ASCO|nr:uncharacterized protein KL911_001357 [Ogataea haglerorum]KAG7693383.1 hypothetical protein KL915_004282 [Ogataea haglerorum]KAG7711933.1 hypothetical protein KL914_000575 [Ogataea haglerorum]KAG7712704.1 hypothetical protein KL950_000575 [Ogataea haglerorum]KAG7722755.1 hypothetical protein KL913_000575 [Ogataea haglerorum]KAG7723144.1 hypothetical protein KL949_000194 [Ogataea haglerorum]
MSTASAISDVDWHHLDAADEPIRHPKDLEQERHLHKRQNDALDDRQDRKHDHNVEVEDVGDAQGDAQKYQHNADPLAVETAVRHRGRALT